MTWCHQHLSALRFGAAAIQSAGGVQQGGPSPWPPAVPTAIHTLTQELRAGPLDLALFYLDDGIAAGDVAAVGAALAHIRTRGSELGLTLNFSKCEVVGVGGVQPDDLTDHFPAELLQHANGSSRLQRNFKFLGAAIGDDGFVQAHTQGRVDAVRPLLEALSSLGGARCSACVPAMAECCMACGATRPIVSPQSYNSLTLWCKQRFPASPVFTSLPNNTNKLPGV